MTVEIQKNLYCIELPLPGNPLKSINCYLLKSHKRSLIIDTGMYREECETVLFAALKVLSVDLNKTDIFITHLHADHSGMSGELVMEGAKCYFGRTEYAVATNPQHWPDYLKVLALNGFPESILKESMSRHPGILYSSKKAPLITQVDDGQKIEVGDFELQCIETPGHSPGHMCLYEPHKKILFSGDHILFDITPNITWWPEFQDSLKHYLQSLDKVSTLKVASVLPGHRKPANDHLARIAELKKHHQKRMDEVMEALQDGDMTAYEVAPYITWKIVYQEWEDFPIVQKFFAVGETLAHLHYLENTGSIKSYTDNGQVYFALN